MSTLINLLRGSANTQGDRAGFLFLSPARGVEDRLGFAALHERSRAIASRLSRSVTPGARAVLCYGPGLGFIEAFFGCLYAGIVAVPIELPRPNRDPVRLRSVVNDAKPEVVLTSRNHESQLRPLATNLDIDLLITDDVSSAEASDWRPPSVSQDDLAYIQYTSGSTTTPKGVMLSHACVIANLRDIDSEFGHDHNSVSVSWLPHFHDMGLVYGVLQPIYNQFRAILFPPAAFISAPETWLETISRYQATHSGGPDFAYARCEKNVRLEQAGGLDLSSWRVAFTGAESVRQRTIERFAGKFESCGFRREAFYPAYGLAEATLKVTCRSHTKPLAFRSPLSGQSDGLTYTSCGVPSPQSKVAIVDPATAVQQEPGCIGEIWVNSPSVASGYWGREGESTETFGACLPGSPERFLRTGDMGFVLAGELHITGRCKDLVVVHGQNRHPEDIETLVAASHPAFHTGRCAAFSTEINGSEELIILVEATSRSATERQLFPLIRQTVSEALGIRVHTIAAVARGHLPMTSSGKVRRAACRAAWISRSLPVVGLEELHPSGPNDIVSSTSGFKRDWTGRLSEVVAEALRVPADAIPPDTPLIRLGLDSIGAIQIAGTLHAEFGIDIPIERLLGGASLTTLRLGLPDRVEQQGPPRGTGDDTTGMRADSAEYRASLFQQRLWTIYQVAPGRGLLNLVRAIHLAGRLSIPRLLDAFHSVTQRHESLRTSFSDGPMGLVATKQHELQTSIPVVDLRELPPAGQSRAASSLERKVAALSIDPAYAPLWRACIVLLSDSQAMLLWSISHLVVDMTSFDLLERELAACYEHPPASNDASATYESFAFQQLAERRTPANAQQLEYWTRALSGVEEIRWRRGAPIGSGRGLVQRELRFDGKVWSRFQDLCRKEAVTPFTLLVGGLVVVLSRCTGQHDLVVSTPVDCRPSRFRNVVGCFANRLPLRVKVGPDQSLREHVQSVRAKVLEVIENRGPALADIQAVAGGHRNISAPDPLSQVLFELRQRAPELRFGAVQGRSKPLNPTALAFDLAVAAEISDELSLTLLFDGCIFDGPTCTWFVAAYRQTLEQMVEDMTSRLGEIGIPSPPTLSEADGLSIDVVANFVADGVGESLRYWMKALQIPFRIQFAPFDQVMQYLLDASILKPVGNGVSVLLIRFESYLFDGAIQPEAIPTPVVDLATAIETAARRVPETRFVVLCCPPSPACQNDPRIGAMEDGLAALTRSVPAVDVVTSRVIKRLYPVDAYFDAHTDRMAGIPYTRAFFAALGTMISRRLEAWRRRPAKVVVVDCDNTLWSGVVGEDGVSGLAVDECRVILQLFLLRQAKSGRLLCICSKNEEQDVLDVLDHHPDMLLRRKDFVSARANWQPKSDNLQSLSAELGIALDSFIYLDDSAVECASVRENCPEVLVLQLPVDTGQIQEFLDSVWEFDVTTETEEDRNRLELYQLDARRRGSESAARTIEEFLSGLNLSVCFGKVDMRSLDRAEQLTSRTNQFNLNGVRRSAAELRRLAESPSSGIALVRAEDRFGDYGAIGLMVYDCAETMSVETFLLSCRALGKRIEHRMALQLAEAALAAGYRTFDMNLIHTPKNTPIRQFLDSLEAENVDGCCRLRAQRVAELCRIALGPFQHDRKWGDTYEPVRESREVSQ